MSTSEINIEKKIDEEDVINFISTAFNISRNKILIEPEMTGEEDIEAIDVLCIMEKRSGEFPVYLEIYNYRDHKEGYSIENDVAKKASQFFKCKVIIIEESDNPYIWLLIDEMGFEKKISVDPDKLDDDFGFYILEYLEK